MCGSHYQKIGCGYLFKPGRFGPNRIVSAENRCVLAGKTKSAGEEKKKKKLKPKIPVDIDTR